jgi:hypothetical protein
VNLLFVTRAVPWNVTPVTTISTNFLQAIHFHLLSSREGSCSLHGRRRGWKFGLPRGPLETTGKSTKCLVEFTTSLSHSHLSKPFSWANHLSILDWTRIGPLGKHPTWLREPGADSLCSYFSPLDKPQA